MTEEERTALAVELVESELEIPEFSATGRALTVVERMERINGFCASIAVCSGALSIGLCLGNYQRFRELSERISITAERIGGELELLEYQIVAENSSVPLGVFARVWAAIWCKFELLAQCAAEKQRRDEGERYVREIRQRIYDVERKARNYFDSAVYQTEQILHTEDPEIKALQAEIDELREARENARHIAGGDGFSKISNRLEIVRG